MLSFNNNPLLRHDVKTNVREHNNSIIIEETVTKTSLLKILGYAIELHDPLFDMTKEYGECNILAPFLNLRRYIVSIETRILGKQPDMLAVAPDFIVGKRCFYNPIFTSIMLFEAKARPLSTDDIKRLNEYIERYKHVFLIVNEYVLRKTDNNLKRELIKLYNLGNLSFVIVYYFSDALQIKYLVNRSSLNNIELSAQILGKEIRKDLISKLKKANERGLNLYDVKNKFTKLVQKVHTIFGVPISFASSIEDAFRKSKLILMFPAKRIEDLYRQGLGHVFSLLTFTSVFLLSPVSGSIKLPHIFLLNELFLNPIEHDIKSLDEMVSRHER